MINITRISSNIHVFEAHGEVEFLLISDLHWDNPHCDRQLLKNHLDEAVRRGAYIIINGDLFCAMQGKGDFRASKDDIRPEHNNGRYLDSIVDTAVDWFKPYAQNIVLVGYGNHETGVIKHKETDILERFVATLNYACKSNVQLGGYGGVFHVNLAWMPLKEGEPHGNNLSYIIHYFHGSGGGGPVTKGVIQDQRLLASIENYDMTWMGHVHELYEHTNIVNRYEPRFKKIKQKPVQQIRTATYKEEWNDGKMGFHVERGRGPKPLGGYWLKLSIERDVRSDFVRYIYAEVTPCTRFY